MKHLPGVVAIVLFASAAAAAPAQDGPKAQAAYRAAIHRLDTAASQIDRTGRAIDQSLLNPVALVGRLDADPGKLAGFVRTQIAYQPYPGALRGAKGTLMARAGNSLDQSVLLAAMLHDAGYEARIDYAKLGQAQTMQVLAQVAQPSKTPPPVDTTRFASAEAALPSGTNPKLIGRLKQSMQPPAYAGPAATDMADWLTQSLQKAGISLGNKASSGKSARAYFWVEYRSDPWDKWHAVQPVFADSGNQLTGLHAKDHYYGSIPKRWQWRLRLKLTMESKHGDSLATTKLLDRTLPVANLAGKALSVGVAPTNLSSRAAYKDLQKTLAEAQLFSARFNGSNVGQLFDLTGTTVDPAALQGGAPGAAAVFMTMHKESQKAAAALTGAGGGKSSQGTLPVQVLTGVWLDTTIIPPENFGKPRRQRRYLLDRIGDAQRSAGKVAHLAAMKHPEIARHLTGTYTLAVSGGRPAAGLLLQRHLQRLKEQRPLLAYVAKLRYLRRDDGTLLANFLLSTSPPALPQLQLLRDSMPLTGSGAFRAGPSVVAVETAFQPDGASTARIDILFDPVSAALQPPGTGTGAAAHAGAKPKPGVQAAILAGVRMTRLESGGLFLPKNAKNRSAYGLLSAARRKGGTLHVIAPAGGDKGQKDVARKVAALDLPHASRDAVLRDLHNGFAVAVPSRLPGKAAAWWRIDPASGETLGMMDDGRGSDLVEYDIMEQIALDALDAVGNIYSTESTLSSVWSCISAADPNCCLASVMGNYVFGLGQGSYMSAMGEGLHAKVQVAIIGAVLGLAGAVGVNTGPISSGACK